MNKDTLGDRIKGYEKVHTRYFTPKIPIIVRVDGKAFHTWTKGCDRPYDRDLIDSMFEAAKDVANQMMGCYALYTQSDEVTFVLCDDASHETQQWFGGRQNKIESVTAGLMTAAFNRQWVLRTSCDMKYYTPAVFDARAFQCPKDDVANVFLWRVRDWERNSLNMFCEKFFSTRELHGKNAMERMAMLKGIDHDWQLETTEQQRNGSWWSKDKEDHFNLTSYQDMNDYIFYQPIQYAMNGVDREIVDTLIDAVDNA